MRGKPDLLPALRNLAAMLRVHSRTVTVGVPPDIAWMSELVVHGTARILR